jgi:glycosyltransferase 2 family protein
LKADPVPPTRQRKVSLWRIAGTLVSLGLLVFVVWTQGWKEFLNVLKEIPPLYVLAGLGLMLISRLAVTLRWYVLLRSADVKIPFGQAVRLVFMGLFASNFLPSTVGGDLVRLAGAIYLRFDAGITAASLLVDRLVGMAGMATFLPFGVAAFLQQSGAESSSLVTHSLAGGLASLPFVQKIWQRTLGQRTLGQRGLVQKAYQRGQAFLKSLVRSSIFWIKHPSSLAKAFLFTLLHMTMTFLTVEVLLVGMGESLSFWWIGGLWSFSYFISLAPISINGLGLQEVSIAYLYSHFGGVSIHTGLAIAVLMRLLFLLASLPGVLFLPDILRPLPSSLPKGAGSDDVLVAEETGHPGGIDG